MTNPNPTPNPNPDPNPDPIQVWAVLDYNWVERMEKKRKLNKAVAYMLKAGLAKAWFSWTDVLAQLKRRKLLLARAAMKMKNIAMGRAWCVLRLLLTLTSNPTPNPNPNS